METIIWEFKLKLKNVHDDLTNFLVLYDFDCFLSNWKYFYDRSKDEFIINDTRTWSYACLNIKKKISDFFHLHQEYIKQILLNYIKLSKESKITNYDKNLIPVLQKIKNKKNNMIKVRDCKKL